MKFRWGKTVIDILAADTSDLRKLALMAGGDPKTFYRGAKTEGLDIRGQDLRGMEFTDLDLTKVQFDSETKLDSGSMLVESAIAPQTTEKSNDVLSEKRKSSSSFWSSDMAVSIGTSNFSVYMKGVGVVLEEPTVIAVRGAKNIRSAVVAVGSDAQALATQSNEVELVRPIQESVITSFDLGEEMVRRFFKKVSNRRTFLNPLIIATVPSGSTPVERRAVQEWILSAGARKVLLIEEALAAAIGAGLPVAEPTGSMIVNIGAGVTDIGITSLGGIVYGRSARAGGETINKAIIAALKKRDVIVGDATAERLKRDLGSALPPADSSKGLLVSGYDARTGTRVEANVTAAEVFDAIQKPLSIIRDGVLIALEAAPPELAGDIVDAGIVLSGGGALFAEMDKFLRAETDLPVAIAKDPMACVVLGAGRVLDNSMKHMLTTAF